MMKTDPIQSVELDTSSLNDEMNTAIDWMVRLTSGSASANDKKEHTYWLESNPDHLAAWQQLEILLHEPLARIREADQQSPGQSAAARRALTTSTVSIQRRKLLGGGIVLLVVGFSVGVILDRSSPLANRFADVSSGTGQVRKKILSDGSTLILNARSAANIEFDDSQRMVRLIAGELVIDVASDAGRPFIVQTEHGRVRALGTRFLVKHEESRSLVVVLEHSVSVSNEGRTGQEVQQGQSAWFDGQGVFPVEDNLASRAAWVDGVLDVRDESLGEVITRLRPYRKGVIRISPQAAQLRVFGVFRLDDANQVLQSLADILPITVTNYSPWLAIIDIQESKT